MVIAAKGSDGGGDSGRSLSDELLVALDSAVLQPQRPAPAVPKRMRVAAHRQRDKELRLHEIATVLPGGRVALHSEPRGPVFAEVGSQTEFGSDTNFWVVKRRRGWIGVTTDLMPNSRLAWIPAQGAAIRIGHTPWWVTADVSERWVKLWRGKKVVHTFPVSVGAPGSPTPPGRYSVTDGLTTRGLEAFYGCCVLALTGHQPNLPAGWIGGDRIAIHGTPGMIGGAISAGCLRASDTDMMSLFRRIPLGTPVVIRS